MTVARAAALGALVLAVIVAGVVLLGGKDTHEYDLYFQNAGQLVNDDDVQIGGRRVGTVGDIELTSDNRARVRIAVEEPFAPLHEGTKAVIRLTSLSGIANRYVALTPGPQTGRELDDGARLESDATTDVVDLDEIFNTLDPGAREDLQKVVQGFAAQYQGKGRETNESIKYFNPLLSSLRRLASELTEDEGTLTEFLVNSSRTVTALADRSGELTELVSNTNAFAKAVGDENVALGRALGVLPTTLRRGNTTFVNLRSTLDDLDVLVAESKPATRELAPFLRELRPLVAEARPTIADLRRLVRRAGPDNDAVEATRKLPGFQRVASPSIVNQRRALERLQPVLEFGRPYIPEFTGWLRDFGQGAASYDAHGHYARIAPVFNAFQFNDNPAGGALTPIPPSQRLAYYQTGINARCPGTAVQPPPDGSAPFTDSGNLGANDCNPAFVPPGP